MAVICPDQPLPSGVEVTPKPGTLTLNRRPLISVRFAGPVDPKAVVMQVDSDDVTAALAEKEGALAYAPEVDLRPGLHRIVVQGGPEPIEWCFAQRKFEGIEDLSAGGELSLTEEYALKKAGQESPRNKLSANLHAVGRAAEGDVEATTEWTVRYQGEWHPTRLVLEPVPGPQGPRGVVDSVDVPNFRTVVTYKQHSFELGDINIQETPLVAPSFGRRGLQLKLFHNFWNSEGHFFGARPQGDNTSEHLTGVDQETERLFGGSVAFSPFGLDPSLLRLKTTYVAGVSQNQAGFGIANLPTEQNGSTLSFLGSTSAFQNRVRAEGEYVISWFDPAIEANVGRKVDKAARARLDLNDSSIQVLEQPVQLRLGGEFTFFGLFYRSIANPGMTTDRQGGAAEGGVGWGPGNLGLNASRFHDNVKDLPQLPRVFTTARGITLALAHPDWPSLSLGATRTNQESVAEPFDTVNLARFPRVDIVVNDLSAQVSYSWRFLSANFGFTKAQTLDFVRRSPNSNTISYNGGLSLNLFDGRLVLSPNFSLTETENLPTNVAGGSSLLSRTVVGTVSATGVIIPGELVFDGQLSLTDSHTEDKDDGRVTLPDSAFLAPTQRAVTTSAVARLTWNFEKYIGNYGRQALSLRGNWNRTVDAVTPTNDRNDFGVFLILDVFAPFLF